MSVATYLADDMKWHARKLGELLVVRLLAHDSGLENEAGFVTVPVKSTDRITFHIFMSDVVGDIHRLLPLVGEFVKGRDENGVIFVGETPKFNVHLHPLPSQAELVREWPNVTALLAEAAHG